MNMRKFLVVGLIESNIGIMLKGLPIHWRIIPYTKEQRWEAFHAKWPHLDRQYFEDLQ